MTDERNTPVTISRRRFLGSTAAVTALAALPLSAAGAAAASSPGDVVGKITVGYQGWYACIGDGAPINTWWHWSQNDSQSPSPTNNNNIKAWPDMREFSHGYQTAYPGLGNGQPATLFSEYDAQTVDTHFAWMSAHGCDTAALQRFNPNGSEGPTRDAVTAKVRTSAEAHGVKFYIMYDATGWTSMQSEMKADWTSKMSAYAASPMYARQNGKPVVGIWGFGFNDGNHVWDAGTCLDVINWFKGQGCYVMGGVPREWRVGGAGTRTGFIDTYHAFNMISPWMVGAIGNVSESDNIYNTINVGDQADCNANGIDYQPCVLPGDVSGRQRVHGDFMWRQFYNMVRVGAQGIYISMFDEFTEGNHIAKSAETSATTPVNSGMLALDEDGTPCSADYYLRLTADGGRMLKGQIALTATRPTPPVLGSGDTQAPSVPSGLHVTGHTAISATLAWTAATDNVGVTGYRIFISGSQVGSTASTSFVVNGLTPSTTYSFTVTAQDAAGNTSPASAAASVTTDAGGNINLALNRPTAESSHTQVYVSSNAVDGNAGTYWESANNAFPQWLQVDLGGVTPVSRIVLTLPPAAAWGARIQTLTVAGSNDGNTFSTLVGSAGYTFDPNTGNAVTIPVPAGSRRYLRLTFTANTGWPAGQVSEFQAYA
jgi:chitodextrinase